MVVTEKRRIRKLPTYRHIREIQEANAKGLAELRKSIEEDRKNIAELRKSIEEDRKNIAELREGIEEMKKELKKDIGHLGNRFGEFVEHIFIPNLTEQFKKYDFTFGKTNEGMKLHDKEHNIYAEIDAFLENGVEAMAVEVKVQLKTADVDDHSVRMEKLRQYANFRGDKREFYGAIAAAIINDDVRKYALKQGFYLVEPSGEDVIITEPFSKKAW